MLDGGFLFCAWGLQDQLSFSKTHGEISEQFEMDIFKYVLMGKHYHLEGEFNDAY